MLIQFSDLNEEKLWSQGDLDQLRAAVCHGLEADEIAPVVGRSARVEEVRRRMDELPWSDHMIGRIRRAARRFTGEAS